MGRNKTKKGDQPNEHQPRISEIVAISIKVQLDNFMKNDTETELKFPSSLSKNERAYIHEKCKKLGIKSKSTGAGAQRYLIVFKQAESAIIQRDATLVLSPTMKDSINTLLANFPINVKEKDDLMSACEKDKCQSFVRDSLHPGIPAIPNTFKNMDVVKFKSDLPVYNYRDLIINAIKSNQVLVIMGETGSGKTTQVPQFILEQCQQEKKACRIICTQPRRISAVSVSERVAYERNENIGHSVGYQIRLESKTSSKTLLTYCTSGVLLRTLMSGNGTLTNVTHIIVDEVHERDKLTDFMLISLKEILPKNKDLRIVLMSATIDHAIFASYFNDCPTINIPGRLFKVDQYFLEDVLDMSKYFSKEMERIRRTMGAPKPKKNMESKLESIEEKFKEITLDSDLQSDVDLFLNDCFVDGSADSFGQIMYMYMNENVPVDSKHSVTGITGLMAAAYHGSYETVEQLVQMGASPGLKDKQGKSAVDYAKERQHEDCAQFLDCISKGLINVNESTKEVAEEENELLDMYLQSVSDDVLDYDLIIHLIENIHLSYPSGSILVFVAGYEDITTLKGRIEDSVEMSKRKYQIFTLHSSMQTSDQKRVFSKMPDTRKVILSTNIAETSITINDVVYIIDSVRAKEQYYEPASGACSLQLIWISKACCKQRAGRAGRSQPGKCFTLCSKLKYKSLLENSVPEILRSPIHELCLQTKRLAPNNTPIADFLSKAIEPPVLTAIRNSVSLLKTIGALTPMENLTEIGNLLLELPVDPHLGKMLIYACILKCLDPILTVTSSLCFNEPFQIGSNPEARKKAFKARRSFSSESMSDHMILLKVFQEYTDAKLQKKHRAFCEKSFINEAIMELISGMRNKFITELRSTGLIKSRGIAEMRDLNINSDKWYVIKAVIFCGLYPNLARVDRKTLVLRANKEVKLCLHPQSTLLNGGGKENHFNALKAMATDWLMFGDMNRIGKLCYIRSNTIITDITVALFAGPLRILPSALRASFLDGSEDSEVDNDDEPRDLDKDFSYLTIDDWIVFRPKFLDGLALLLLREKFAAMMIRRMECPSKNISPADNHIIETVVHLLAKDEFKAGLALQTGIWQGPDTSHSNQTFSKYNDNEVPKYYGNSYRQHTASNHYAPSVSNANSRSNNNYANKDKKPYNNPRNTSYSQKHSNADKNCKFFLVKVPTQRAIEESWATGKWEFTAGTEKSIIDSAKAGFKTFLFFSVSKTVQKFYGWAEFVMVATVGNLPVYPIKWISKMYLSYNTTRHLTNPLDENRPVAETRNGSEISYNCSVALMELIDPKRAKKSKYFFEKDEMHSRTFCNK